MKRKYLNGYIIVYMPSHPKSIRSKAYRGWVYEHVMVAEKILGRELSEDEVVHHLDLIKDNNHPTNLLVLLRSQHAKLHSYLKHGSKKMSECPVCGITSLKKYCSVKCRGHDSRKVVNRPSKEELLSLLENNSFVAVGKMFGVSDNAVRKWIR